MPEQSKGDVTTLLTRATGGDEDAKAELFGRVEHEFCPISLKHGVLAVPRAAGDEYRKPSRHLAPRQRRAVDVCEHCQERLCEVAVATSEARLERGRAVLGRGEHGKPRHRLGGPLLDRIAGLCRE